MNKLRIIFSACVIIAAIIVIKDAVTQKPALPPLIPRNILFENPAHVGPKISPDGTILAYSAPWQGVMNLWIRPVANLQQEQVITQSTNRPIFNYSWSPDSKQLLYLQDTDGDEDSRLYGVNVATKQTRCYTPFEQTRTERAASSVHCKDKIIIAMNKENKAVFDYYQLDLQDGTLELILKNPGNYVSVLFDTMLKPRAIASKNADGSVELLYEKEKTWQPVFKWNCQDAMHSGPLSMAKDNVSLYLEDTSDAKTSKLICFNPVTKTSQLIAQDQVYDFGGAFLDNKTNELLAVYFDKERIEYQAYEPAFGLTLTRMRALHTGDMSLSSSNEDKTKFTLTFNDDRQGTVYYFYDTTTQQGTLLFKARPSLEKYTLSPMRPISFTSRDGLKIHGYLTLPVGIPAHSLPLILYVHGGPQSRDSWGFDPAVQWLANRGYAVLQVNYRGSSGYGKAFERAGDREWGRAMHHDLLDAVAWAVKQGFADPAKVAIYGASYGGYAALVGATFTPDMFSCAVSVCGPTSLITFLETIPPYWDIAKADLYRRVGNITEKEFLKSRSPLYAIDAIKKPLLIAHGARDPRVKKSEAEQFVAALKTKNIPHEYMLFEDEGHGLLKPHNRMQFYTATEAFLEKHLGGRKEVC